MGNVTRRPRRVVPVLLSSTLALGAAILVVVSLALVPGSPPRAVSATRHSGPTAGGLPAGARDWGPAPAFSLPSLAGGTLGPDHWRGRPLLLAFWASWCTPCQAEAPVLVRLARHYGPRGVAVLAVDVRDLPADARRFARTNAFSIPIVADPTGTVAGWYGVAGLPTLALIGRTGHLISLHPGPLQDSDVAAFLAPALAG